ncbi:MAG: XrtA-associated tyrosine autokinase [Pseudomonadota bacterium]
MDSKDNKAGGAPSKDGASLLERAAEKLTAAPAVDTAPLRRKASGPTQVKPALKQGGASNKRRSRRGDIDLVSLRENGFIVPDAPTTTTAEEFRLIKRQLLSRAFDSNQGAGVRNGNLILVCSSQPNEGKTYCAINLALSMASERDNTVLLVDADFSKPEVLTTLGLEGGKGLVDIVTDPSLDMSDCLIRTNIENLSVLPTGRQHHLTTELIASDRMGQIVSEIAARYRDRIVIFDSPPALASSAGSVLAMHVGQVVFVVEADNTTESELKDGLSMVSACSDINLLLNKTGLHKKNRRFGNYYGYGS